MKISEMIAVLKDTLSMNGDMDVVIITNGEIYDNIDFNCTDDSPLYIEGYRKEDSKK